MYKPFIIYYLGDGFKRYNKVTKLAECNSLESARKFVKKKSGGQACTYPWDGATEVYDRYVIDKGNVI